MSRILMIISVLFRYNILTIVFTILFIQVQAQDENKFQPDSVYRNHKVKRIYVYENSPKDLFKIIDLDTNGHKVKLVSYDRETRARKRIARISSYTYDSEKKLVEELDSATYSHSSDETDHTRFFYNSKGVLKASTYGTKKHIYSETEYAANPFQRVTTRQSDSLIMSRDTEEYDRDFYEKRTYGYSWEATLKTGRFVRGADTSNYQYSDDKDLKKLDSFSENANLFNSKGQLISTDINQRFMVDPVTWRTFQATLTFNYYANGLLRSIRGYIPEFFKYEFFK
jgi:hypothetical protein